MTSLVATNTADQMLNPASVGFVKGIKYLS